MTDPGDRQDATPAGATVAEAAARLRVTPDAVRRRLHRGTLAGAKTAEGEWRVWFPDDPPGPRPDDRPDDRQDTARTRQDVPPAETEVLQAYVADLRADVAYLRDQLDQRSRELAAERERFDVLHREALGRIPALGAGSAPEEPLKARSDGPESPSPPASGGGLLARLRRLLGG